MATEEDRTHAVRLLKIHKRNLERLEEKKAKLGSDTDLATENAIDEERANIAALEPLVKPAPSQKVQAFVTQASDGNWAMMFSQFVLLNTRMTQQEEQNQRILDEQSRGSIWRLHAGEDIQDLKADKQERAKRQHLNFMMQAASLAVSVATAILVYVLLVRAGIL